MPTEKMLLSENCLAVDFMYELAREAQELQCRFAHAGRNNSCPCGSERKFKKCQGL